MILNKYWTKDNLEEALARIKTPSGVQGSDTYLFKNAIFGRDSLMMAYDLLPTHKELCGTILHTLARMQGEKIDLMTGEEPGRIHHEYRARFFDGYEIDDKQQEILEKLHELWNIGNVTDGKVSDLIIYSSVDATPQFVRVVAAYCGLYGPEFLNTRVTSIYGTDRTVGDSVLSAMQWLSHRISTSDLDLVEFHRTNPHAHEWEVLRDGKTSYLHEDGTLANSESLVASIEVQGLAYDALLEGSKLIASDEADIWKASAQHLRLSTLKNFWIPEHNFFAMAIDRDVNFKTRKVKTLTSAPMELLDTQFFNHLPHPYKKEELIGAIVKRAYSSDFLTSVGIRQRALRHYKLVDYSDYHGSLTSWVVIANILARGLRRQNLTELAEDIECRFMSGLHKSQELYEFFYVSPDGAVDYDNNRVINRPGPGVRIISGTNVPERTQGWTVSAAIRVANEMPQPTDIQGWRKDLIDSCLREALRHTQPETLTDFYIDIHKGRKDEDEFVRILHTKEKLGHH